MDKNVMSLPNVLSLLRSFAGFVVIYLILQNDRDFLLAALVVMVLAECSDAADGFFARRYGLVSRFGMIIDPMSDSLYRTMVFLGMMAIGWLPVWFAAILMSRDIIVAYLRVFAQQDGITLAARTSGKLKAVVQASAQIGTVGLYSAEGFLSLSWPVPQISFWLLALATAVTAWSALDYIAGYRAAGRQSS